jgi:hypothetical protein
MLVADLERLLQRAERVTLGRGSDTLVVLLLEF